MDVGLLMLRLVLGLTLAAHGAQKVFGWFGGHGLAGTGKFMEQLGFRPGRLQAALAGLGELGGGLGLAAGFLTPAAAAVVVAVMLVAAVGVHLAKGFFINNGGFEYPLLIGSAALALAFTGPGQLSLDQALGLPWAGVGWGLGAVVAGLTGGALSLLLRRPALRSAGTVEATPAPARPAAG